MKAKTKLQKAVEKASGSLGPLSPYRRGLAVRLIAPHFAAIDCKGEYTCSDCGHKWHGERAQYVTCPGCGAALTLKSGRWKAFHNQRYFTVITTSDGFQLIRVFRFDTFLRRGQKAEYRIEEAFQRWMTPEGRSVIISRPKPPMPRYLDSWNFGKPMTLAGEHDGHTVYGPVIGTIRVLPVLRRNGMVGQLRGCNPHTLLCALLQNNKIETLWKVGEYALVGYCLHRPYSIDDNWPSIRIAIRHGYKIDRPGEWLRLLQLLRQLGRDLHNPKLICPDNLCQSVLMYEDIANAQAERVRQREQRQRELTRRREYFESLEYLGDERAYEDHIARFADIKLEDGDLVVEPLRNIGEFADESEAMHHCLFSAKYFNRRDCLILHALRKNRTVATVELRLSDQSVQQCRGYCNAYPEEAPRIVDLIDKNKSEIAKRLLA